MAIDFFLVICKLIFSMRAEGSRDFVSAFGGVTFPRIPVASMHNW